ncbi:MAG: Holliday junction branch migration protein RuvA [Calditrichaeota bacterium]|nr:Holliday junction branch migration protein RuvA [Calditrichota bacterium]
MIETVTGKLIEKSPTYCVLDCHGVGLGIHITLNTFHKLEQHPSAEQISLYTHLHVREDDLQLYGFGDPEEKEMFRLLIGISGVGPRLALAVLSGISTADLQQAISMEQVEVLTRIPGVGRKTAQRIVLELKEKIQRRDQLVAVAQPAVAAGFSGEKVNEAILALISLGYKQADAEKAVNRVLSSAKDDLSLEELIKQALKAI